MRAQRTHDNGCPTVIVRLLKSPDGDVSAAAFAYWNNVEILGDVSDPERPKRRTASVPDAIGPADLAALLSSLYAAALADLVAVMPA